MNSKVKLIGIGFLLALALTLAPGAHAATITVPCDVNALINAITTANTNAGADTLELAANCTYTLTSVNNTDPLGDNGLPKITSEITINARGATIQRNNASAPDFRFFQVASGATLRLNDLTLRYGRLITNPKIDGGAILNKGGTVAITNVTLANNSAGCGGALYNESGTFIATASTFSQNSADG
jgi:hypothetical protein